MKSLIFKLFLTLIGGCFIMLFALPWNYFGIEVPFSGPEYKLGLDLSGGIELDYKVDLSQAQLEEDYNVQRKNAIIEGLKSIIDKRVETLNINDSIITSASYAGEEHIIVQIPLKGNDALQSNENIERAKAAIGQVVKIEFKELRDDITAQDMAERKIIAQGIYADLALKLESFTIESQQVQSNTDNVVIGTSVNITDDFSYPNASGSLNVSVNASGYASELLDVVDGSGIA
jgi:hypothetical protein